VDRLIQIAYQLPDEIERVVEQEAFDLNAVLTRNRQSHAQLLGLMRKTQIEKEVEGLQLWENAREQWRSLRHTKALREFATDLSSATYEDPTDRDSYLETWRGKQMVRHESRKCLQARLGGLTASNISSKEVLAVREEYKTIAGDEIAAIQDCYNVLTDMRARLATQAAERVEALRHELHHYGALHPEPDMEAVAALFSEALAAPDLAELWRTGGGLKPEVSALQSDLRSPDIVYDPHVRSMEQRLQFVCASFSLKAILEERGRLSALDKSRNLIFRLRTTARAELPELLDSLLADLTDYVEIPKIPELFRECVTECMAEMQRELEKVRAWEEAAAVAAAAAAAEERGEALPDAGAAAAAAAESVAEIGTVRRGTADGTALLGSTAGGATTLGGADKNSVVDPIQVS
jgi:hypothetical protein